MQSRFGAPILARGSFLLLCSVAVFAQTGGGTGGTGGSGTTTGGTATKPGALTTTCSPGSTKANCPNTPGLQRPIFLSGKVIMDDGSPVPHNVAIDRVCAGVPHREGFADSQGNFNFQLGRGNQTMQDASERVPFSAVQGFPTGLAGTDFMNGGLATVGGETSLTGCELHASLPGYRSSAVDLTTHRALDNPDVGIIVLQRFDRVMGTTLSVTAYKAPKDARSAFEHGLQALKQKKTDAARLDFEKAVALYPGHAEAWVQLGILYRGSHDAAAAHHAFQQALNADPKYVLPYMALADLAADEANWSAVAQYTQQGLELDPLDYPGGYFLNAVANFNLKKFDVAENSARRAQRLDPEHHIARLDLLMGNIFLVRRDYADAAQSMRAYLKAAPDAVDAAEVRQKIAELEQVAQKKQ